MESLLNSRPLTTVSDDPNDEPVLTPNHFLIGQIGGDTAPDSVDDTALTHEIGGGVYRLKEYLPHIGSRHKCFLQLDNLKEDDTLVDIDPNAARKDWKVGRIVRTYPGGEGLVRVVDVKVGDRILKRPVTRLSPFEINN